MKKNKKMNLIQSLMKQPLKKVKSKSLKKIPFDFFQLFSPFTQFRFTLHYSFFLT